VHFDDFFVQDPFSWAPRFSSLRHRVKTIRTDYFGFLKSLRNTKADQITRQVAGDSLSFLC